MKLKSFKIEKYRSCKKTEFPINEDLTTLIGVNGSGKTNILNAIYLLHKLVNSKPARHNTDIGFKHSKFHIELLFEMKTIILNGKLYYDTNKENKDTIVLSSLYWNFKEFINFSKDVDIPLIYAIENILILKEFSRLPLHGTNIDTELDSIRDLDVQSKEEITRLIKEVYDFFSKINYYNASIFTDPTKCPSTLEFEGERVIRNDSLSVSNFNFLYSLYNTFINNKSDFDKYLNIINKNSIGLVDNIDFKEYPLQSDKNNIKGNGQNIHKVVFPQFEIDGNILSPNQLSDGTFRTLALIFYLLNDKSKLLLIEEPEICVHHGLLRDIIEIIKVQSKEKQIIISTHSDYVIDQLKPENLVIVKIDKDKGTTAKPLDKTLSKRDLKALHLYLNETGNLGEYWKESGFDYER